MNLRSAARLVTVLAGVALALPAVALAIVKQGQYAGMSSVKIPVVIGTQETTRTDVGSVSFKIKAGAVTGFTVKKQQAFCGGQSPVVDVKIASMKLSKTGTATGKTTDPNLGPITAAIKVTPRGLATGTVTYAGLCQSKAAFTAHFLS